MQVTVKGSWLKVCGKGSEDRTFTVLRRLETSAHSNSGFRVMYDIECDGHTWTVAECRLVEGQPQAVGIAPREDMPLSCPATRLLRTWYERLAIVALAQGDVALANSFALKGATL